MLIASDPAPIGRHTTFPGGGKVDRKDYDPGFVAAGVNEAILGFVTDGLPLDPRDYYATLQAEGKPRPVATGVEACIEVKTILLPKADAANILARLPGSDPALRDEVVILSASGWAGPCPDRRGLQRRQPQRVGAAVLIEAARVMKASGWQPRRTVVFAFWAPRKSVSIGSTYYAEHPLYPLEKTVANINLDCVGQGGPMGFGGL